MGLVEDEVLERSLGEEGHVGEPGGQDLQLPEVGQQDAGLALADVLLGAALLGRGQEAHGPVLGLSLVSPLLAGGQVGFAARAREAVHRHLGLGRRSRADPLAEGDPRAAQHVPQPVQLVVGQGVHRVDEDRRQPLVDALVPLPQQVVDDRVEERLGLARPGAGSDQDVLSRLDRLEDLLLVQPHRRVADQTGHDRVQQTPVGHRLDRLPLGERFGERDERPLDQGDVERGLAPELLAGLRGEVRVRDRERGEDVPQELVADAVGKLDRVDGHRSSPLLPLRCPGWFLGHGPWFPGGMIGQPPQFEGARVRSSSSTRSCSSGRASRYSAAMTVLARPSSA